MHGWTHNHYSIPPPSARICPAMTSPGTGTCSDLPRTGHHHLPHSLEQALGGVAEVGNDIPEPDAGL